MQRTKISWCDVTANFWMGCCKISDGCKNCYAETLTKNRMGLNVWGPASTTDRKPVKNVYGNVRKANRASIAGDPGVRGPGYPLLVFVGSLMDWAENHPDLPPLRKKMWETIRENDSCEYMILTKRTHRIKELLPADWGQGYPGVWLGTSIEDMRQAWRADALREIPAVCRFISYEPALGPLDEIDLTGIDQVLYGGESGPGYRPEGTKDDPKCWARSMRERCREFGTAFFHKQSAAYRTEMGVELDGEIVHEFPTPRRIWTKTELLKA